MQFSWSCGHSFIALCTCPCTPVCVTGLHPALLLVVVIDALGVKCGHFHGLFVRRWGSLLLDPDGVEAGSVVMVLKSLMGSISRHLEGGSEVFDGLLLMGSSLSFVRF